MFSKKTISCWLFSVFFSIFVTIMNIVLIGAGNLATHLGLALKSVGHRILQVYSRTEESATALAQLVGATPVTDISSIVSVADVYVFSVKDSALEELIGKMHDGKEKQVFLHTAGSMPIDLFNGKAVHYGVLYPMQTFSKKRHVDFKEIPCFVEGIDEYSLGIIKQLADSVSDKVYILNSLDRKFLHLAAVFACNFVNHCYALSSDIVEGIGLPFDVLLPLVDETARKVHELSPVMAQTGPAVRFDGNVIQRHVELLGDKHLMRQIYSAMSESIHRKSLENADVQQNDEKI